MLKERLEIYKKDLEIIKEQLLNENNYEDIEDINNLLSIEQSLSRIIDSQNTDDVSQETIIKENKERVEFLKQIAKIIYKKREISSITDKKIYMNLLSMDTNISISIDRYNEMIANAEHGNAEYSTEK